MASGRTTIGGIAAILSVLFALCAVFSLFVTVSDSWVAQHPPGPPLRIRFDPANPRNGFS